MSSTQFASRHIGPTVQDQDNMLKSLGFESMNDLIDSTVPETIRVRESLDLPAALSEHEALKTISDIASRTHYPVPMQLDRVITKRTICQRQRRLIELQTFMNHS